MIIRWILWLLWMLAQLHKSLHIYSRKAPTYYYHCPTFYHNDSGLSANRVYLDLQTKMHQASNATKLIWVAVFRFLLFLPSWNERRVLDWLLYIEKQIYITFHWYRSKHKQFSFMLIRIRYNNWNLEVNLSFPYWTENPDNIPPALSIWLGWYPNSSLHIVPWIFPSSVGRRSALILSESTRKT